MPLIDRCDACNGSGMEAGGAACRGCRPYARLDLIPYCIDCGSPERAVYWGGGPRCQACSDKFRAVVQRDRAISFARERDALAAHIAEGCPDDGIVCESCCDHEHDPDEGMMCIHCDKEWDGP
jgi:hypothetical protein